MHLPLSMSDSFERSTLMSKVRKSRTPMDLSSYIPSSLLTQQELQDLVTRIETSLDPMSWLRWTSCFGKNPELFESRDYSSERRPQPTAQDLCALCPVRALCAQKALENIDHHAYSVMGGVSLPCSPSRSERTRRQLNASAQDTSDVRKNILWHIVFSIHALRASHFDSRAGWSKVSSHVNWPIFTYTCTALGIRAPRTPKVTSKIPAQPRDRVSSR